VRAKLAYNLSSFIEFEVELNGIPVMNDSQGKDVSVNFIADDFNSSNTFWTDSNGLEMQERILNYRESFQYTGQNNVSGNYYPVTSGIAIRNFD